MTRNRKPSFKIKDLDIGNTLEVNEREGNRVRSLISWYKKYHDKHYTCTKSTEYKLLITRTK